MQSFAKAQRAVVPAGSRQLPCSAVRPVISKHAAVSLRQRFIVRSAVPYQPELVQDAETCKPASGVAMLVAGASVAWALLSCDRAYAADSSGRISGSTFGARRTSVQANGTGSYSGPSSSASFTRNNSNHSSTTNVNTHHSTHSTTHVNHTTVVVAAPSPIIPIPVMMPMVAAPVIAPVVTTPVIDASTGAVVHAPVHHAPVVVTHHNSMMTTVIGLLSVVLLLFIISQVMSAFSGSSSSSRYS